jgi:hypothetical protein
MSSAVDSFDFREVHAKKRVTPQKMTILKWLKIEHF